MKGQFASTMLLVAVCGATLVAGTSLAQRTAFPRTDQQAQLKSVLEIETVGRAMFGWLTDEVGAAAAGQSQMPVVNMGSYPTVTRGQLTAVLVPQYLPEVPELDGWDSPYEYRLNVGNPLAQQVMAIRSTGRDHIFSGHMYSAQRFEAESFDEDIVWADGYTVRSPSPYPRTDTDAQARTVADIRKVGAAMLSWLADQAGLTAKGEVTREAEIVALLHYPVISAAQLRSVLVPQYLNDVPERDGWDTHYDYRLDTAHPLAQDVMAIRSAGRDKAFSTDTYLVTGFDADDFNQDIVWASGSFVRWPETVPGQSFHSLSPCRIFDTRSVSALQSGVPGIFEIEGACGIPTSASSVSVNVTVVGATGSGYVTLYPAGLEVPTVSTVNFAAGQTRSNNAVIALSGDTLGSIAAQASVAGGGQVHLIVDVSGFWE